MNIKTRAKEVYDVSGAGDTVIATFTLGLSAGAKKKEAAVLANLAAGNCGRQTGHRCRDQIRAFGIGQEPVNNASDRRYSCPLGFNAL